MNEELIFKRRNRLKRHFVPTSNVLLSCYRAISDAAKITFQVIDGYDWESKDTGESKGYVFPAVETLVRLRGVVDRTIRRHIAELIEAKLLTRTRRRNLPSILYIEDVSDEEVEKYFAIIQPQAAREESSAEAKNFTQSRTDKNVRSDMARERTKMSVAYMKEYELKENEINVNDDLNSDLKTGNNEKLHDAAQKNTHTGNPLSRNMEGATGNNPLSGREAENGSESKKRHGLQSIRAVLNRFDIPLADEKIASKNPPHGLKKATDSDAEVPANQTSELKPTARKSSTGTLTPWLAQKIAFRTTAKAEMSKNQTRVSTGSKQPQVKRKKLTKEEKAKRDYFATEIATQLHDEKSLGCYRVIAEKVPDYIIFETLGSVKESWKDGKIKKSRGALFVDLIKEYCDKKHIDLAFSPSLFSSKNM